MVYHKSADIDPIARALIGHKVWKIIRRGGFTSSDRPDLEQELALQAHVSGPKYDPRRGARGAFYDCVMERKAAHLLAHHGRQKRDRRQEEPLDEAAVPARVLTHIDLKLDVRDALSRLPSELRTVATLFMEGGEAEVIRRTGLSRQRVRGRCQCIGVHLAAIGLGPGGRN